MGDYKLIWCSSDDHMETFHRIFEAGMRTKGLLSIRYDIPEGYPFLTRMFLTSSVPVVMWSAGALGVSDGAIHYQSRPWHPPLSMVLNLRAFSFEVQRADVLGIEPYLFQPDPGWPFRLSFVRLRTRREAPLDNLLLGVGAYGFARQRRRTAGLQAELERCLL